MEVSFFIFIFILMVFTYATAMEVEVMSGSPALSIGAFCVSVMCLGFLTTCGVWGPFFAKTVTNHIPKENYEIVKLNDKILIIDKASGITKFQTEKKSDFNRIDKFDGFDYSETTGFGPDISSETIKFSE